MKVGDLVRHKHYSHTLGIIVKAVKTRNRSRVYSDRTLTIQWIVKPWYVAVGNPHVFAETLCQLEVINEDR